MQELLSLVTTLRARISTHGVFLRSNEALTRATLIEPVLRQMGWDTEDPSHVVPEFAIPSSSKKADYALFAGRSEPDLIVEAKRLGDSLAEAKTQALNYCTADGYASFAVTDGQRWTVYATLRPGKLEEKRIADFDIRAGSASSVVSMILGLWRPRFLEGGSQLGRPLPTASIDHPVPHSRVDGEPPQTSTDTTKAPRDLIGDRSAGPLALAGVTPLSALRGTAGSKPVEIVFPTGESRGLRSWTDLLVSVTVWLVEHGCLSPANLPVPGSNTKYLVAEEPVHPNGDDFGQPKQAGHLWVEAKYPAAVHAKNIRKIVERSGRDLDGFGIRMGLVPEG